MKILVVGGTGATGTIIVDKALAAGHEVTVLARDPSKVPQRERLRAVKGDLLDAATVEPAVAGQDAVVFAAGSGSTKPSTLRRTAIKNIVDAMKKAGGKRLVAMSGLGAGETLEKMPFIVKKIIVPLILKGLLEDQNALEAVVKASGLEWTIVRPGQLVAGAERGAKVSLDGTGITAKIAYADVAAFIVDELAKGAFVHKAPALGY